MKDETVYIIAVGLRFVVPYADREVFQFQDIRAGLQRWLDGATDMELLRALRLGEKMGY